MTKTKKKPSILTTAELRERLKTKFPDPEWVLLHEVRDATGWDGNRSADCMALATWPSRGCVLYGFELKTSRGDVVKELKNPQKADPTLRYCDRWYLVLGHSSLIKESEVPATWGLIVPHGKGLRIAQESKVLKPKKWRREFVASMVRNAHRNQASVADLELARQAGVASGKQHVTYEASMLKGELAKLQDKVKLFEEASGVTVLSEHAWHGKVKAQALQFKALMQADVETYLQAVAKLACQIEAMSAKLKGSLIQHGAIEPKPSMDEPCPHPGRHGRHEIYIKKGEKKRAKKTDPVATFCRACGAEGEFKP